MTHTGFGISQRTKKSLSLKHVYAVVSCLPIGLPVGCLLIPD